MKASVCRTFLSLLVCVLSRMSLISFVVQFEDLLQTINSCLSENHIMTFELFQSSHLKEHISGKDIKTELAVSMSLLGKVSHVGGVAALKDAGDKDAADFLKVEGLSNE